MAVNLKQQQVLEVKRTTWKDSNDDRNVEIAGKATYSVCQQTLYVHWTFILNVKEL